jgi:type I site-specific restriction endonuclease
MTTTNTAKQLAALQSLIDGLEAHTSDIKSLVLGNTTILNADMVTRIQGIITSAKATAAARATYLEAVASSKAARAAQRQFLDDLRQTLRARFSTSPTTLAQFALTARTRAKPTPTTSVAAAAKAKATRAARGTKGSKERSEVQGNVTGVVVTPVVVGEPTVATTSAPATAPVASGAAAPATPATPTKS